MFVRKFVVSLVFAAAFAQALAALAEHAAVKNAAAMTTVLVTAATSEAPTSCREPPPFRAQGIRKNIKDGMRMARPSRRGPRFGYALRRG